MFKRLERRVIHRSPWLNLYQDDVTFPNGVDFKDYHVVEFEKECVACLAKNEKNEYLLVELYRYPIHSVEWELPGGGVEKSESLETAAKRELLEETGYDSRNHEWIYEYYPLNGSSNQKFSIMKCEVLEKTTDFDHTEIKSVRWFTREELVKMIKENKIRDGSTLVGLFLDFGF
jgi:8-oxo-dGTP pyrophosphatase MutT (NUDIX family)